MGDEEKEKFPKIEKFKLIMDYVKWFIVSVVLVVIAMIIDKGFKDRDMGLKEIAQYDKYIDILIINDNVGAKIRLAEFFSIISTSKVYQDRWKAYLDSLKIEYAQALNEDTTTAKEIDKFDRKANLTPKETENLNLLKKKKLDIELNLKRDIKIPATMVEKSPEIVISTKESKLQTPVEKEILKDKIK